ncbi:MAG: M48 family metallopeptidase, partial [bacterium]
AERIAKEERKLAFKTFVVEEIFDFNKQTVFLWLKDLLKELLLVVVFTAIIAGAILWFISFLPETWWLAAWGFTVFFGLLMQIIYPRIIAPLFNEFEPIEEGELYEAVREVFDRAGFECSQVYSMDASRRSGHSNAYFVGFGKTKRVVLFDTLIEQMEIPQLQAVLAHELAHWKKGHIWKNILQGALKNLAVFYIIFHLLDSDWLYQMFEISPSATYAGLVLAGAWISPINRWLSPLENYFSVKHEKEADDFALQVMRGSAPMVEALYRLVGENLSNPFPHPLYTVFHYSHPPVPSRIRRLQRQEKERLNLEE